MLDIRKIKENPDAVKAGLKAKEVDCDAIFHIAGRVDDPPLQYCAYFCNFISASSRTCRSS